MDHTIVDTPAGRLQGRFTREGDVLMFLGIPYAAPPVGPARLRPPQPPAAWPGIRDATHYGAGAAQKLGMMEQLMGGKGFRTDEDCLTVNVWTPGADDGRRPVMVWIHGGAFLTGTGATSWYDGRNFCRSGDVVVVTINYRLGALGFLHLAEIGGEAWATSGNTGLLDQIAALAWVRDNIEAFGGNPADLTVFGESAGGMSVGTLLGTPAAAGLFQRAIAQSGASSFVFEGDEATAVARQTLVALGVDPTPAGLGRLTEVPADAFVEAQESVIAANRSAILTYRPVVDGVTLPEPPLDAIAAGSAAGVALLCGTTAEEMRLFNLLDPSLADLDDSGLLRRARAFLGDRADDAVATYRSDRPAASNADVAQAMATDAVFRIPAIRLLERQAAVSPSCWAYLFSMRSTAFDGALGACHGLEIPFVFDNLGRPGVAVFTGEPPGGAELAARMHRAWVTFARTGNPGHDGLPDWPAYDTIRRATMDFDATCRVLDDPMGNERAVWD
jgi:para-nitrobenzyl esterase